jgi:hypothetical protein
MDIETIFDKVRSVEAMNIQNIIPPCSGAQYACAYDYMCDKREISPADLAKFGDDVALAEAIERYDDARAQEDILKVIKAAARDDVIAAMAGRKKAEVGLTLISYQSSKRKTLNVKKLRVELGDKLDGFYDEKESTTLRVTKAKKETDE